MYISFEYFSCNCKAISFRRFILLNHSRENVYSTKLLTKNAGYKSFFYTIPDRLCAYRSNISVVTVKQSVFIDVFFNTIPERMCTGQSC